MSLGLLAVAAVAGLLIGLSLGALGGGGSVLAVPVLVYALGQTPGQATTGSLVVVGLTSLIGAVTAHRAGNLLLGRGMAFGAIAIAGAAVGARAAGLVPGPVLMAAFAVLLVLVAAVMVIRQVKARRDHARGEEPRRRTQVDDPILTFSPTFACACPRALKVLVTATVVGLLTGFLGVGGGFLVVPALVLALGLPMELAAGTSLVVITITSVAALASALVPRPTPTGRWSACSPCSPSAAAGSGPDWRAGSGPIVSRPRSPACSCSSPRIPQPRPYPPCSDWRGPGVMAVDAESVDVVPHVQRHAHSVPPGRRTYEVCRCRTQVCRPGPPMV